MGFDSVCTAQTLCGSRAVVPKARDGAREPAPKLAPLRIGLRHDERDRRPFRRRIARVHQNGARHATFRGRSASGETACLGPRLAYCHGPSHASRASRPRTGPIEREDDGTRMNQFSISLQMAVSLRRDAGSSGLSDGQTKTVGDANRTLRRGNKR